MKLEIKHLAGYLPYGLKVQYKTIYGDALKIKDLEIYNVSYSLLMQDKPILHPLSDLTKEIEVNGEKFVPLNRILEIFGKSLKHLSTEFQIKALKKFEQEVISKELPYKYIQKLIEWHFDIYGLIKAGLAIDINTLKEK
jgi:hypothetical protein